MAVELARISVLYRLPDAFLVQNIPDDAFYYLEAARNFARFRRWTFDGVEPSSGFHLLWGYILAGWFRLWPTISLHTIFLASGLIQSACLSISAWLTVRVAERVVGERSRWGVLVIFLSSIALLQGTGMMESGFVVLCSVAIFYLLSAPAARITGSGLVGCFFLGILTSLSRSDAGLPVAVFLLGGLWLWRHKVATVAMAVRSATMLGGAVVGIGLVTLNTHWISGEWVQASAQEKVFWTHVAGPSLGGPIRMISNFVNPLYNVAAAYSAREQFLDRHLHQFKHHVYVETTAVAFLIIVLIILRLGSVLRIGERSRTIPTIVVPAITVLGYIAVYRFASAALQYWYIANFQVPCALLTGIGFASLVQWRAKLAYALVALLVTSGVLCSFVAPFPWAEDMWQAGALLRHNRDLRPVGAWNAGIVGFVSDAGVINLDGLMNDSVVSYTRRGDLSDYLLARQVTYLIDSPQMLNANSSRLGGYDNGRLQRCLSNNQDLFPKDPYNTFGNDHIRLYTVNLQCLSQQADASGAAPAQFPTGEPRHREDPE